MAWFKEHLLNPYARGMNDLSTDRVTMMNDFNALKKELIKPTKIFSSEVKITLLSLLISLLSAMFSCRIK